MERATSDGTSGYARRFAPEIPDAHYHEGCGWRMSSIGLGTYLGEMDSHTDASYESSVKAALAMGCNVLDTAINYRFQRSERNIGNALRESIEKGIVSRNEIVISTKGGFVTFDGDYPPNPARYFQEEYIAKGICLAEDVVGGIHCMTPTYLNNQLERSLKNLQLDSVDIYLIHNPETQLSHITRQDFMKRILAAFRFLEEKVSEGKIQVYGTATWDGYRASPQSRSYLSLEELIGLARLAGGDDHHFRVIQLPFNLGMPEAFVTRNQKFGSESVSLLEAARRNDMIVLTSASILQGQLASRLPDGIVEFFSDLPKDSQRSIQFVRSTPGVTTALVGMSKEKHVKENMELSRQAPLKWEKMKELFTE